MKRKGGCLIVILLAVVPLAVFVYGFNPWFHPGMTVKKLAAPNPTSYVFRASVDEIRAVLREKAVKCCGDEIEFKDDVLFSGSILKSAGNENDAYIHNFHTPLGSSDIYFSSGKALPYICEFHLHITPVSKNETQVSVVALKSEVIAGQSRWGLHGFSPANWYVNVSPTTVEEYKILREIGSAVGTTSMPALQLPTGGNNK